MTGDGRHGRSIRQFAVALAALLVLGGAAALVVGLTSQVHAPQPAPAAAAATGSATGSAIGPSPAASSPSSGSSPALPPGAVPPLPAALPTHLDIPAIGVSSDLLHLGLEPDGSIQVPPLTRDSQAGWYQNSPTPGELGPSVILGHVDSAAYGAGVFFRLGALKPGDTVGVTRADGSVAQFRVDRVASYAKADFPTLAVYGNTQDAELRLITCGGQFDRSTRNYLNNIVVYASLTGESS